MNTVIVLIYFILLGLCQSQIIDSNSTTSAVVTDAPTDATATPLPEVTALTSYENVTVGTGPSDEDAMNEILSFGDNVIFILSQRLPSLPLDMRPFGQKILNDTRHGLKSCENDLRENGLIWEYKVCASSSLRYAMSTYAGLIRGNASSGGGRPRLFFM